ncbi:hypothetical protein [Jeotgalibacillus proteolyticus]|uniref:Uncharacterized protein n=1 Tax=Jeotgalibacillus proteolyticus TaxID=2082395 RepID=A0A2S5GAN1_9BACL|nr:hypothetical protein [Jeotgalibacillus proteolyticus]PPA70046.1 hypothetical protein C4B60_10650 [Jeotgalibacillus proteolyticus]
MAKLVIKKKASSKSNDGADDFRNEEGLFFNDYHTTVDGVEIRHLTSLKLMMSTDAINECSLTFFVDHVDVDADFLAAVKVHIEEQNNSKLEQEIEEIKRTGVIKKN